MAKINRLAALMQASRRYLSSACSMRCGMSEDAARGEMRAHRRVAEMIGSLDIALASSKLDARCEAPFFEALKPDTSTSLGRKCLAAAGSARA
ncbi:MAG TPA: hypothetical protein VF502_11700 [Stellaceae bacterium]